MKNNRVYFLIIIIPIFTTACIDKRLTKYSQKKDLEELYVYLTNRLDSIENKVNKLYKIYSLQESVSQITFEDSINRIHREIKELREIQNENILKIIEKSKKKSDIENEMLKETLKKIEILKKSYPYHIKEIKNNKLYFYDGSEMIFDDYKEKTIKEKLEYADIEDQLSQKYPLDFIIVKKKIDPGRIRNTEFFKKIYGSSESEVRKNLVPVYWLPSSQNKKLLVSKVNGVAKHLQDISNELDTLEYLHKYINKPAGTFNWREIEGANRLSMHSFGIAIDINVKQSNYWRWNLKKYGELEYHNQIPIEIVRIFEKHGFIWGGKWYHFDTMHFEYRPELLDN